MCYPLIGIQVIIHASPICDFYSTAMLIKDLRRWNLLFSDIHVQQVKIIIDAFGACMLLATIENPVGRLSYAGLHGGPRRKVCNNSS